MSNAQETGLWVRNKNFINIKHRKIKEKRLLLVKSEISIFL